MTKAIIFDLDNCLAAPDEAGRDFYEPALAAIREANRGHLDPARLVVALDDCWRYPLDLVAKIHGFSEAMTQAGREASRRIVVHGEMRGYEDLEVLRELDVRLFLVTSGFRCLQDSKIDALGIRNWFDAVLIDDVDDEAGGGKKRFFEEILLSESLKPEEVLVVGDSERSEIDAGRMLGIPTVQILRPGVKEGTVADHRVRSLWELRDLLKSGKIGG